MIYPPENRLPIKKTLTKEKRQRGDIARMAHSSHGIIT